MTDKKDETRLNINNITKEEIAKIKREDLIKQLILAEEVIQSKIKLADAAGNTVVNQQKTINDLTKKNMELVKLATNLNDQLDATTALLKLKL